MMTTKKDRLIGDRIKELRQYHKMKQSDFAEEIGVAQSRISDYEANRATPHENTILRICEQFGVSEFWLIDGEGEMYPMRDINGVPMPAPAVRKNVKKEADIIRVKLAEELKLTISEVNELIRIVRSTEDASYFRLFIKAIKGDKQAKKELMVKLLSEE